MGQTRGGVIIRATLRSTARSLPQQVVHFCIPPSLLLPPSLTPHALLFPYPCFPSLIHEGITECTAHWHPLPLQLSYSRCKCGCGRSGPTPPVSSASPHRSTKTYFYRLSQTEGMRTPHSLSLDILPRYSPSILSLDTLPRYSPSILSLDTLPRYSPFRFSHQT